MKTGSIIQERYELTSVLGEVGQGEVFRSEHGLSGAGPRFFDFDIDYVPIEERMMTSRHQADSVNFDVENH